MSLKIENIRLDVAVLAIANILEDLGAAKRNIIPADKPRARIALAAWIRDKKAELDALCEAIAITPDVRLMIEQATSALRRERAELARYLREKREAQEAERAALLAELEGEAVAA